MKVVILAGGLGSRLSEETKLIPKPMVEIGRRPILWHIMKIYSHYGYNDFIVLTGYKSHVIKDYFVNYYQRYSDITVDMKNNSVTLHKTEIEPWNVTIVYTGEKTATGSRIKRARQYVENERFMLTYGDGVGDIDINKLLKTHEQAQKFCTITAVQPSGRYGVMQINSSNDITSFQEKRKELDSWVNGGFMVCEPQVFDYIEDNTDDIMFEEQPLEHLAQTGQLNAYKHKGFWRSMDTIKDKNDLTDMYMKGQAPWILWNK